MRVFLYTRLTKALLNELASGVHKTGSRFLSNRKICHHWRVSQPTAASSLSWLAQKGLLTVKPRSGVYVNADSQKGALRLLFGKGAHSLSAQPDWEVKRLRLRSAPESAVRRISVILSGMEVTLQPSSVLPSPEVVTEVVMASVRALLRETTRHGYHVQYHIDNGRPDHRQTIVEQLLKDRPDGVIAFRRLPFYIPMQPIISPVAAAGIPVVTLFDDCEGLKVTALNINNVGLGYNVLKRFLRMGHRRIGVLLPKEDNPYFRDRAIGAQMAVDELATLAPELTVLRLLATEACPSTVVRLFREGRGRPTALFVTSASLFYSLWPMLNRLKLKVPEDVSVITVAGSSLIPGCNRSFDVMKIDFPRLGKMAAAQLVSMLKGEQQARCTLFNPSYYANGSTRSLKAK